MGTGDEEPTDGTWLNAAVVAMASAVGLGLIAAGVVAVFVSSNASGTAALLALGPIVLFCVVFRDRLVTAKMAGFEVQLARRVRDHLRASFDKRLAGNYEAAEDEIQRAFDRFIQELDGDELATYNMSKQYHDEVRGHLEQFAQRFQGTVQSTSATSSFFPLVDLVLNLNGPMILAQLASAKMPVCPSLRTHLEQELHVGVTIRPGPELDADLLVNRLWADVEKGALNATCFLLIQNCTASQSAWDFRRSARQLSMHATSAEWKSGGSYPGLANAVTDAILTVCSESLAAPVTIEDLPVVTTTSAVPT